MQALLQSKTFMGEAAAYGMKTKKKSKVKKDGISNFEQTLTV
jgi:hypothetical protein